MVVEAHHQEVAMSFPCLDAVQQEDQQGEETWGSIGHQEDKVLTCQSGPLSYDGGLEHLQFSMLYH